MKATKYNYCTAVLNYIKFKELLMNTYKFSIAKKFE